MKPVTETPEFLAWCLVHPCPLRQTDQLDQPLATERALKSLRAVSIANLEGRIWDGICLDQNSAMGRAATPRGFPQAEVLSVHGGEAKVNDCCGNCPANTDRIRPPGQNWSGCFGWLALEHELKDLPQRLDECLAVKPEIKTSLHTRFPKTAPAWYGLWMHGSLDPALARLVRSTLSMLDLRPLSKASSLEDDLRILDPRRLLTALDLCVDQNLFLAVELIPRGYIEDRSWLWPPHCGLCKHPREMGSRMCDVCSSRTAPLPAKKRKTRGTRPFIPLNQFLGTEGTKFFLDGIRATEIDKNPGD